MNKRHFVAFFKAQKGEAYEETIRKMMIEHSPIECNLIFGKCFDNILFFETENYDVTEENLTMYYRKELANDLISGQVELYIKQISSTIPVLFTHEEYNLLAGRMKTM